MKRYLFIITAVAIVLLPSLALADSITTGVQTQGGTITAASCSDSWGAATWLAINSSRYFQTGGGCFNATGVSVPFSVGDDIEVCLNNGSCLHSTNYNITGTFTPPPDTASFSPTTATSGFENDIVFTATANANISVFDSGGTQVQNGNAINGTKTWESAGLGIDNPADTYNIIIWNGVPSYTCSGLNYTDCNTATAGHQLDNNPLIITAAPIIPPSGGDINQILASSTAVVSQVGGYLAASIWGIFPAISMYAIILGLLLLGVAFFIRWYMGRNENNEIK